MKTQKILTSLLLFLLVLNGCKTAFDAPEADPGNANLSRCVAVGGDFLSGYYDDALRPHGQQHSIAALLTQQFALAGGGEFKQSLVPLVEGIGVSNKPWNQLYDSSMTLGYEPDCNGEINYSPSKSALD